MPELHDVLQSCRRLRQAGRQREALAGLELLSSLHRDHPEAHALAGELALDLGQPEQALRRFQRALELDHANGRFHLGEATAFARMGSKVDAMDSLQLAIAFEPRSIEARLLLAELLAESGENEEASTLLEQAYVLAPDRMDVLLSLARARNRSGNASGAIACYDKVLELSPFHTAACVNLGLIWLLQRGDPVRAERLLRTAMDANPDCHEARANLGLALHDQRRFDEALHLYRQGLEHCPGNVEYRWNRGLAYLLLGRFEDGWQDYDLRFEREGTRLRRTFGLPRWDGNVDDTGGILVYGEQGLGDEIMFSSCIPDLLAATKRVVLECQTKLEAIFRRSFPGAEVCGRERSAGLDAKVQATLRWEVPIGSLPAWYRRTRADFPSNTAYLRADAGCVARARVRLKQLGDRPRIGLCWRGGGRSTRGALRSLPPELAARFLAAPYRWICLQHSVSAEELTRIGRFALVQATDDLDELAGVIASVDAVVTVDSTVAHLAGSLGVPTWLLLCTSPDWRWQAAGESSPWYPSLQLVRQEHPGNWQAVIDTVLNRLAGFFSSPRAAMARTDA